MGAIKLMDTINLVASAHRRLDILGLGPWILLR